MSETCPKCGRVRVPKSETRIYGAGLDGEMCPGTDWISCMAAVAAYRRGLREGVEMAKREAWSRVVDAHEDSNFVDTEIDWSDVDAELARRVGGE